MRVALAGLVAALACGPEAGPGPPAEEPAPAADVGEPAGGVAVDTPPTADPDTAWTAGIIELPPTGGGVATLRAVRAARHAGFDRVVWELSGPAPGVHVEYVDRPVRQCGSGNPVPLPGDAWLEVRLSPAAAHTEEGRPTMAERRAAPGLPIVLEIVQTCDFEAVVAWALAARSPERFRVARLDAPARVVVDVRHPAR